MKTKSRTIITEAITLEADDKTVHVALRYSRKAKNIAIRINHLREVELVVPKRANVEYAKKFLMQKQSWLFKKLNAITEPQKSITNQISIFGQAYRIEHREEGDFVSGYIENGVINIFCSSDSIGDTIIDFLKEHLLMEITAIAEDIAKQHCFSFNKISIKRTNTKWGSCSSKKNLSFNWRLVFAPKVIVRYVVVHELCHLKEMNHSSRFWALVRSIDPDFANAIGWLKKNQAMLYSYFEG